MQQNETYLVVLEREDIMRNSLFGAVLISTEQKTFDLYKYGFIFLSILPGL